MIESSPPVVQRAPAPALDLRRRWVLGTVFTVILDASIEFVAPPWIGAGIRSVE